MTVSRPIRRALPALALVLLASGCAAPRAEQSASPLAPTRPTDTPQGWVPGSVARLEAAPPPDSSRFQQQTLVLGTFEEPTELAVTRDGRVFVTERRGNLRLFDPRTGEAPVVARLDVFTENENGLIGVTLDPRFEQNRWIYLARTVGDTLNIRHRLSRFTWAGDSLGEEKVMLEVPVDRGCCHTGGSLTFDAQGNLFVSFGDNTNPFATGYTPIDDAPGRQLWDARRASANTRDLRGKILRITPRPDGGYTVPAGNLFADTAVGRPEIYTMGHRNPYRISVDRRTGFVYWGEIGPDARVDSIWGPKGYDEVNQARRAGNFGWPLFIADNKPYRDRDIASGEGGELFDPARPVNDSRFNTGARELPAAQPALIWYPYEPSAEFPLVGEGGRSAMAGPVYHSGDFPTSAPKLPAYYDGKLIIYEWMRGWMRAVTLNEQGDYVRMEPFLEHLSFDHPIDVELGPDGSLYVLEYGTFWFAKNPNARLSRIVYHQGNRPPVAHLSASRTVGAAPLTVRLSARESRDRDPADTLHYTWTFDGDAMATGPEATHTFTTPGTHTVRLAVRDLRGGLSESVQQVLVGNAPPEVSIRLSGNRSFFWDAAPLSYHVQASDPEDGRLGRGLNPSQVRVTLNYVPSGVARTLAQGHQSDPPGLALMRQSDCMACHATDQASVGPSFRQIAQRYAGDDSAVVRLAAKIIAGGGGVWGERVMPAHPTLRRDASQEMVRYILSLASAGTVLPPSGTLRLDRHQPGQTGAYVLTARYVDRARNGIGPLEGVAEVVLRSPVLRAAEFADGGAVGVAPGRAADGQERPLATAYASGAHLRLGETDLTGVGALRLALQSQGYPVTVELRAGGVDGTLLASAPAPVGGKDAWVEAVVPVSATGQHDLFVVLRSDARELGQWNPLARLDTLRFERAR